MPTRWTTILAAALLAAALTACGSSGPSGETARTTGATGDTAPRSAACSLLSDDDITSAGGRGGTHVPDTSDFGTGCNYGVVRLYPNVSQGQYDFHDGSTPVEGVGQEAWLDKNTHQLRFRTATQRLVLVCALCEDDGSKTLPPLANAVIGNLPG